MLNAEAREGAAELRGAREIHLAAGGGGVEGPAGAVRIEGDGQTVRLEDHAQRTHDGGGGLAGPELRIEHPLGRVVQDGDEGLALRPAQGEPGMAAAVEVQQLAEARARLAPAPMAPPGAPLADEAGLVEREPDEGVGQGHAVIAPGEMVEVPHVETGVPVARPVALAIQSAGCAGPRPRALCGARAGRGARRAGPARHRAHTGRASGAGCAYGCRECRRPATRSRSQPTRADHLLDFHGPLHSDRRDMSTSLATHGHTGAARKADTSFALGSGQIMCSLHRRCAALTTAGARRRVLPLTSSGPRRKGGTAWLPNDPMIF